MDICVWEKCNNRCLMCTNPDGGWPAWDGSNKYDIDSLKKRILASRARFESGDSIYLTGGEPTIHPSFFELLKFLSKEFTGQRLKLLSNGRAFYYKPFALKTLKSCERLDIDLSLCGPDSKTHDNVTRVNGSFEQAVKGLKNLLIAKSETQKVGVRFVISKITLPRLVEMYDFLMNEFPKLDHIIFLFYEVEEKAQKNLKILKINYKEVAEQLELLLPKLGNNKDFRLFHFPLCTLSKKFWPYIWNTWPENEICYGEECVHCAVKDLCVGIHKHYVKNFGRHEFKLIKSNDGIEKSGDKFHPIRSVNNDI